MPMGVHVCVCACVCVSVYSQSACKHSFVILLKGLPNHKERVSAC